MSFGVFPYNPNFTKDDSRMLSPFALALQMRVSPAFIRICFDAGCPQESGRTSAATLLHWLFEHYPAVRTIAGLRPLVPVEGLNPETALRIRMGNAIMTLLEYSRTRASDWRQKRALRIACEHVDRLLDLVA